MRTRPRLPLLASLSLSLVSFASACAASPLRDHAGAWELQVLVGGAPAPTYEHHGETYLLGHRGDRYTLRVVNRTGGRIEAVVSVDGRDVIDGRPGSYRGKRGYLVPAWGSVDIDGWRLTDAQAAAFRFSSVADSYAARTGSGRDVGVIGVAVFPERPAPPPPRPVYRAPRRDLEPDYPDYGPRDGTNEYDRRSAPPVGGSGKSSGRSADGDLAGSTAQRSESAAPSAAAPSSRPGLGTEFGESVDSQVQEVEFTRANSSRPASILGVRYNDRDGLVALGIDVDHRWYSDADTRRTADPFPEQDRRFAAPPPGWRR